MLPKLLRVTQLDAIQLDDEVIKIFKALVDDAFKYLPPGLTIPFEPEIKLIIRLLILNYSIIKDNATFGQKLLLIKYSNLTNTKKILYVILSCMGYIKERCEYSSPQHKINTVITFFEMLTITSALINMSIFLRTGSKPMLIDRILGLEQEYVKYTTRQFNNKYLSREIIWNGCIEMLLFILPFINYHKLRRVARNIFTFSKKQQTMKVDRRIYNLDTRCPHCGEKPILPHHMGCAHIFCYVCLKANQLADSKYECPVCGYNELLCERVLV